MDTKILNGISLLRDKKSVLITGNEKVNANQFFVEVLKLSSQFCKEFIGNVHGLDFEIIEGDNLHLEIGIKGQSKETLMKLSLTNSNTKRPQTIINIEYNSAFYPIKKNYDKKNKSAIKIFMNYIKGDLSFSTTSH